VRFYRIKSYVKSIQNRFKQVIKQKAPTHTSAMLTLSSPADDVFDFLQVTKSAKIENHKM